MLSGLLRNIGGTLNECVSGFVFGFFFTFYTLFLLHAETSV